MAGDGMILRPVDLEEPLEPLWEGFETLESAKREDLARAAALSNLIRRIEAGEDALAATLLDVAELRGLRDCLATGIETAKVPPTIASAMHMRIVRHTIIGAMLHAFAPDPALVTTTVLKDAWRVRPQDLLALDPLRFKHQFVADLKRTGVAAYPDSLIGFFHGEFEPTSGTIPLHVHLVTTRQKAALLRVGLRQLNGYQLTATGASAIRRTPVRDPPRQLSYLLKPYWPQKTLRLVGGKVQRDRKHHRIDEPYHSLVLLWLDRQRLCDLTIINRTWSPRLGGSESWRSFYLLVQAL